MPEWAKVLIGALRRLFRGRSEVIDKIGDAGADAGIWYDEQGRPVTGGTRFDRPHDPRGGRDVR